jgi:hypothetical protein
VIGPLIDGSFIRYGGGVERTLAARAGYAGGAGSHEPRPREGAAAADGGSAGTGAGGVSPFAADRECRPIRRSPANPADGE